MTPLLLLGVSVFGGLGAAARLLVDGWLRDRFRPRDGLPWGIFGVNVSGSLLLGLVVGAVLFGSTPSDSALSEWATVIGVGFCGGYTTFSTALFDSVLLARDGRWRAAVGNTLGTVLLTTAAAALGLLLGATLS